MILSENTRSHDLQDLHFVLNRSSTADPSPGEPVAEIVKKLTQNKLII